MVTPSNTEVTRRLAEVLDELRGLRADIDRTYVRQDVYRADLNTAQERHVALVRGLEDLRADQDGQRHDATRLRQLVFSALAAPILVAVVVFVLSSAIR